MTKSSATKPKRDEEPRFLIGSYVLETLTTGMYVEPRDAIREYIQNAYDAIRSSRDSASVPSSPPRIDIIVSNTDEGFIQIKDTGASIPSDQVWETLTSIGASRKNPRRQAGFRGIGRLAGIAYCDRLDFTCKAAGETIETKVTYDCAEIRKALRDGDEELEPVFRRSVSLATSDNQPEDAHYTVVTLNGLSETPDEMRDIGQLAEYLRMVAPVDFREGWAFGDDIRRHAESIGQPIPTVPVFLGPPDEPGEELRKPYSSTIHGGKKPTTIRQINFFEGGQAAGARWWGWYADTALYGIVSDEFAGFRLRSKNIQLGDADILTRTLKRHARSYTRFTAWHIGEIYIEGETVFPNARRDGLEDSPSWRVIEDQIAAVLVPLAKKAYAATKDRNSKDFATVKKLTDTEIREVEESLKPQEAADPGEPVPDRKATERKLKAAIRRLDNLNLDDYSDEQQTDIRESGIRLRALAQEASVVLKPTISSTRSTPSDTDVRHRDILDIVFDVLQSVLDTRTFNKARQALLKRFREL
jgi:molecular chaperone HtpG